MAAKALTTVNRRRRLSNAPSPASDGSTLPDDDATTTDDDSSPTAPMTDLPSISPVNPSNHSKLPTLSPVISNDDDHAGNDDTTDGSHGIGDVPTLPPVPAVLPTRPALPPRKTLAPRPAVIHAPHPTALQPRPTVAACTGRGCAVSTHFFFSFSILLLVIITCVCWFCGWRRRHDLDTSRGEYRRVTSRYTADAFDDALDEDDDDDAEDDDAGYENNGTHIIELKQFDRGQLSLKEVNG
jgi:hypothetical protein